MRGEYKFLWNIWKILSKIEVWESLYEEMIFELRSENKSRSFSKKMSDR